MSRKIIETEKKRFDLTTIDIPEVTIQTRVFKIY